MSSLPHFITNPTDSSSLDFRHDCMAWELYTKKTAEERKAFIKKRPALQTEAFTNRLRRCQAWWMLAYLSRTRIESDLWHMPSAEQQAMRQQLNAMREEIKQQLLTTARGNSHA